jgi:CheY-like chemotaxis protein
MPRILSLDDEPEMLRLLGVILERAGYEHLSTSSTEEALSILRSEPVDLLTQDRMRPEIDGVTLCRMLKADEALRRIPVCMVTAYAAGATRDNLTQVLFKRLRRRPVPVFKVLLPGCWIWEAVVRLGLLDTCIVDGFVTKPFAPQDLIDTVASILQAHERNAPAPGDAPHG